MAHADTRCTARPFNGPILCRHLGGADGARTGAPMRSAADAARRLAAYRVRTGEYGTDDASGACGLFFIDGPCSHRLKVIGSDGSGWVECGLEGEPWEHVSVSLPKRCPNWKEMCFVKDLFWGDEEVVVQFHPPRSQYVSIHDTCLHLWRPKAGTFPMPPVKCV